MYITRPQFQFLMYHTEGFNINILWVGNEYLILGKLLEDMFVEQLFLNIYSNKQKGEKAERTFV